MGDFYDLGPKLNMTDRGFYVSVAVCVVLGYYSFSCPLNSDNTQL